MCTTIHLYRTNSRREEPVIRSFDPLSVPISEELLNDPQLGKFARAEIWIAKDIDMTPFGWSRAKKADGSFVSESILGTVKWEFPASQPLEPFPSKPVPAAEVPFA